MMRWVLGIWVLAIVLLPGAVRGAPSVDDVLGSVLRIHSEIPKRARTARALGTKREGNGVIIDGQGLILTVGYIILEASAIRVEERGGGSSPATFVGYDSESGLGLIRAVNSLKGKPIQMGTAAKLKPESPLLIATHEKEGGIKSAMVVSRRTFAGYWEYLLEDAIFTSPPIENFAGAALIDSDLRLVGIGSLFVRDAASADVHFPGNLFIPIDKLFPVLADLIASGRPGGPPRPWLGVYVTESYGRLVVTRTAEESPARANNIGLGDIILKVEGQEVLDMADFFRKVWRRGDAGVILELTVLQGSEINKIRLKSSDRYQHYINPQMR